MVGPDLSNIATRKDRRYMLESILFPNKQIAPGFENANITLKDGTELYGMVKTETDTDLTLDIPNVGVKVLKKAEITERRHGLSSMPDDISKPLSKQDLRNLVEFLASQK